jgi:hypothetical protein
MRKVVQICPVENTMQTQGMLVALCDDGTIWIYGSDWHKVDDIPQPPPPPKITADELQNLARGLTPSRGIRS